MANTLNFKGVKGLHYIHGNIRSLFNKINQLKLYLVESNISCLGLSETWLTNTIPDNTLYIPGYSLLRLDRSWLNPQGQIKKGGGVFCYINTNMKFTHQELDNLNCSSKDIEIHHILIEQPSIKKCILLNIYRPPQGSIGIFTEKLLNNITYLNNKYPNAEIIMFGDFNLNVIDKNSDDARHVKWIEQATGLKQYIDGITRYSNNNSCIDLLFTNMINNFSVNILDLNISDHQFIHINRVHVSKEKSKLEFIGRSYKHYDQNVFQNNLLAKDWNVTVY